MKDTRSSDWEKFWAHDWATHGEALVQSLVPWNVGASRPLFWANVALIVAAALLAAQAFGWLCGRLAEILIKPRKPRQ